MNNYVPIGGLKNAHSKSGAMEEVVNTIPSSLPAYPLDVFGLIDYDSLSVIDIVRFGQAMDSRLIWGADDP
ncbi:MAG: hypothetical protein ACXWTS_02735 [Methylococcaceae bacterium]